MRYSNDLREKGIKQIEISKLLNINRTTLYMWTNKYKETGNKKYKTS